MPRNPEDARNRLRIAALELFAQHGYDQTTAAQIAERAGVTERTFFRHFPDKREVLFDGQAIFSSMLTKAISEVQADVPPIETVRSALAAVAPFFEANRPFSEPRQRLIDATPALQERETAKHHALIASTAEALQNRGVEALEANLAAQIGLAVLSRALATWFARPGTPLVEHLDQGFADLKRLTDGLRA